MQLLTSSFDLFAAATMEYAHWLQKFATLLAEYRMLNVTEKIQRPYNYIQLKLSLFKYSNWNLSIFVLYYTVCYMWENSK